MALQALQDGRRVVLTRTLYSLARAQILGILAQVIAALPIIVISVYLARAVGLVALADFTVLVGVSALALSVTLLSLRSRLLVDRLSEFDKAEYVLLRLITTCAMMAAILVAGFVIGAHALLIVAVLALRVGDAGLDLVLGIDQVELDAQTHLYAYLGGSVAKLLLVVASFIAAYMVDDLSPYAAVAGAGAIYAGIAWWQLSTRFTGAPDPAKLSRSRLWKLAASTAAFLTAQIVCAILTTSPRIALTFVEDRELAGSAAAALSVATFVGMAYYAVWLRWGPAFGKSGATLQNTTMLVLEMSVIFIALEACFFLFSDSLMRIVFGLELGEHLRMSRITLMASTAFFFIMTISNTFKFTPLPWLESVAYLGGLVAIAIVLLGEGGASIPLILVAGAVGMAGIQAIAAASVLVKRPSS